MNYFLYFLLIALTIYTDSFLSRYLNAFGNSLLPTVCLILYPYLVLTKKVKYPKFCNQYICLLLYALSLSLVLWFIFVALDMPLKMYGEDFFIKTFKVFLTLMTVPLYGIILYSIMQKIPEKKWLTPFFVVNIFMAILACVEYTQIPHAFSWLHSTETYYRIRLLTHESSHTAPLIELFFIMAIYYATTVKKSFLYAIITVIALLVQISLTGSKSFLIVLFLACIFGGWDYIKSLKGINKIGLFFVVLAVVVYLYFSISAQLLGSFHNDIDSYTSTSTRLITNLSGYTLGTICPIGTGFWGYLYFFPKIWQHYINLFSGYFNMDELVMMLTRLDDDRGLTAKSFFSQMSAYWGGIGSILFIKYLLAVFKNGLRFCQEKEKKYLKTVAFVIIVNLFTCMYLEFVDFAVITFFIMIATKKENLK